jgi:hypothetical protein
VTSKPAPIVCGMVVADGQLRLSDEFGFRTLSRRRAEQWGDGVLLTCRIEPADEAYTYSQLKAYWGYVIKPIHLWSGHSRVELHSMFKQALLIEGQTSLTQMNRDEMDTFIREANVLAREECWEAFERFEDRAA